MVNEAKTNKSARLTPRQSAFVDFFIGAANFHATNAAISAGYSKKTAYSIGSENLKKPEINAQIKIRLAERTMGESEILARLTEHGRGSLTDVLDEKGRFSLSEAKKTGKDRLLKELTVTVDKANNRISYKYKIHDAQAALDKLAGLLGMKVEKHEHKGEISTYQMSREEWEKRAAERLKEANKTLDKFDE